MILSMPILDGSEVKKKKMPPTTHNPLCRTLCRMGSLALLILLPLIAFWVIFFVLLATSAHGATPAPSVRVLTALDGSSSGTKETNMGDLVADAAASAGLTQIALIPADEVSTTVIQPGAVDPEQIVLALSYYGDDTDTVQTLDLTGTQILDALARSVSRAPQSYPGFLQVSGLKVTVNKGEVTAVLNNGAALDPKAHYKVAMSAPLAAGELGYFSIWGSEAKPKDAGVSMAQALRNYLAANKQISGTIDNRITIH